MICVEQLKLVFDFKNKNLPIELLDLFKLNSDINSHITRNVSKGAIFIPQVKTTILELNFSGTQRQFYGIILLKLMKSTEAEKSKKYLEDYFVSLYRKTKFVSTFIFSYIIIIIVSIIVIIIIINIISIIIFVINTALLLLLLFLLLLYCYFVL